MIKLTVCGPVLIGSVKYHPQVTGVMLVSGRSCLHHRTGLCFCLANPDSYLPRCQDAFSNALFGTLTYSLFKRKVVGYLMLCCRPFLLCSFASFSCFFLHYIAPANFSFFHESQNLSFVFLQPKVNRKVCVYIGVQASF